MSNNDLACERLREGGSLEEGAVREDGGEVPLSTSTIMNTYHITMEHFIYKCASCMYKVCDSDKFAVHCSIEHGISGPYSSGIHS